ncbi:MULTISPECIES: ABC transporter ATP-binding protein [Arthrobacter]|uniref:ABC transporter ATP-binding protein n=2 Tax=Arthrobacter TaxID=1663 RepID=A0ABU9KKL4_9MICC|nr:ABC transporter ATP-binding protein [Arthrobacter sp. YJM1]MDP5226093.1 ABC transporter ATP-binding protein [Arthrobacter sp. YJM1]
MRSAAPPVLLLDSLVKDVGPVTALDGRMMRVVAGLSMTAHAGEVTALLGVNGAGKTTTLECAQGLQRRTEGRIELLGEDPDLAGPSLRARVGVMLQDGGLPPSAHPLPLLRHIARMYQDPWPVDDLVQRLQIAEFARTNVRRLSGGQKQRLALAAALLGRPEVLFLDEPSAGMDPQSRQLVFRLIEDLRDSGMGIILTTHLMDDAERLADYVYIIDAGRVVAEGTVPQLLARQSAGSDDARTLTFEAAPGLSLGLPERLSLSEGRPGFYAIDGVRSPADLRSIAEAWEAAQLLPHSLAMSTPTLEEVFLDIAAESADRTLTEGGRK